MSQESECSDRVGTIVDSFMQQCRRGQPPEVDEYVNRYPELSEELRELLDIVSLLEGAKESDLGATTGSEPADSLGWKMPGQIGDYRILREAGRGGMGIVYEAEQISLQRRVALKVLPAAAALDPHRLERFQREARAAARLHHTNIASVYGIGQEEGLQFFVMQYLSGHPLDAIIDELNRLHQNPTPQAQAETMPRDSSVTEMARSLWTRHSPSDTTCTEDEGPNRCADQESPDRTPTGALEPLAQYPGMQYYQNVGQIGLQVAEALAYAHAQGMLHRDVKPSNLLMDDRGTVWLTDFGLAKQSDLEGVTQSGELLGTLRYMAPECLRDETDNRSDVYSLGLTLFELASLVPARSTSQRAGLVQQVHDGTVPNLRRLCPQIPLDLETIIRKATVAEPQGRYQTAADLAADLRCYLDDEPIRARRITIWERMARWTRRNPFVATTAGISALAIALTIVIAFFSINAAKNRALTLAEERGQLAKENSNLAERERNARRQTQSALLSEAKQRRRAEENYQQAEAARVEQEQAAEEAKAVRDFLVLDMIGATKPEEALGREVTVREMLDRAAQRVGTAFTEQPKTQAAVRAAIGQSYHAIGLYDSALMQLSAAHESQRRLLGQEHLATLRTAINLAATLYSLGKYAEEQKLEEETLAILQRKFGPDQPETLDLLSNLAANLHSQGKRKRAQELFEQTLKRKTDLFGPEHDCTLTTMSNLATNLSEQGLLGDSETLYRKLLEIRRRKHGPDHPGSLLALGNLATNLDRQKRHGEAEPLHRQVLAGQRKVLGSEHPDTLAVTNNLAVNLGDQGKRVEARKMLDELVNAYGRLLGQQHPSTITAANNAAMFALELGDNAAAQIQLAKVAKTAEQSLGPGHPTTLQIMINLGAALAKQGKLDEASAVLEEVVEIQKRLLGPDHPTTLTFTKLLDGLRQGQTEMIQLQPGGPLVPNGP
jgi:serine/threonine protein kinase